MPGGHPGSISTDELDDGLSNPIGSNPLCSIDVCLCRGLSDPTELDAQAAADGGGHNGDRVPRFKPAGVACLDLGYFRDGFSASAVLIRCRTHLVCFPGGRRAALLYAFGTGLSVSFANPGKVVKAIEKAIPVREPAREELKAMEAQKADIDRAAVSQVHRELWCGLAYLVVQTAGFMRLTFWELSWDVMEPICFYVTSMYFMAGYAFFLRTKKEPSFEGFFESRFAAKQKRLMQARGFDLRRYVELRRACGLPPVLQVRPPCATAQESGRCHSYCHCH